MQLRRYLKLLRYLWPQWRLLAVVLVTLAVGIVAGLAAPWPMKVLIDNVLGTQPLSGTLRDILQFLPGPENKDWLLAWVVIATLVIFLIGVVLHMVNNLASIRLSQRMTYGLGADLFLHLQRMSLLFHARRPTGDTVSRVTIDPSCVNTMVMGALVPLLQSVVTMVAMFTVMYALEPTLTLLSLAIVPFLALTVRLFAKPLKDRNRTRRDMEGAMMSVVEQTLTAIPVVQAFTREHAEHDRFVRGADQTLVAYERATWLNLWFKLCVGLATTLGTAGIMYMGARYALDGRMTVGTILVFLAYLSSLYAPLNAMTQTGSTLQYAAAQADRVLEILDLPLDVADEPGARARPIQGHVRYEDVTFGYEDDRPVIKGVSLEAKPGEVVAIVGPTGAGKTTLVNLLVRFFDPWSGRVTIDGEDIRRLTVSSLREQIAIVLQDPFLFPFSIAENIAYGRPDANRDEIVAAAKAANAHSFIERLPEGYDTVIGERGTTLSGGEKQRIALARAFLKDAPIVILDEPTSALDARTEGMLLDALERLMEGRLTLIIAHRLSTIREADRILVVEGGEIVQQGRHDELLEQDGLYATLYRKQMDLVVHEEGPVPKGRRFARGGSVTRWRRALQAAFEDRGGNGRSNGKRDHQQPQLPPVPSAGDRERP